MTTKERHLAVLVRKLSVKLSKYHNGGARKPEVNWTMLDLATDLNQDLVRSCENQCDYQFVLSLAISDLNRGVGHYLGEMDSGSFGRYCRSRKRRLKNTNGHTKLEYELLGLLFDIPRTHAEYSSLMNVIGEHSPKNK